MSKIRMAITMSKSDIAAWAGVTIKTIQRDVQSCNGLIKKAG
jgi:hypothetical protein